MMKFLVTFLFFISIDAKEVSWVGQWLAVDEWKSEFIINIKNNGKAHSNYANGEDGSWKVKDGNLEIIWESGKKDYIFLGVMGTQRLHKSKSKSYTSGLQKLSD